MTDSDRLFDMQIMYIYFVTKKQTHQAVKIAMVLASRNIKVWIILLDKPHAIYCNYIFIGTECRGIKPVRITQKRVCVARKA